MTESTTHDPLCPIEPNPLATECRTCDLIAEIRADERVKAGQRVNTLPRGANISLAAAVAAGDVNAGVGW